jgi:hypothetical protein
MSEPIDNRKISETEQQKEHNQFDFTKDSRCLTRENWVESLLEETPNHPNHPSFLTKQLPPVPKPMLVQALETGFPGFAFVHFAEAAEADQATRQGLSIPSRASRLSYELRVFGRFDSQNIWKH